MRASRLGLSLSFESSATAVFDPAKLCLPSSPFVNGIIPIPISHMKFNYCVDIVLVELK